MPKKALKNAFYFFMMDFRDEQRKKGINYENLVQVSAAAGPLWQAASKAERAEYEQRAKQNREQSNGTVKKYTSLGQSYDELDRQERMIKEAQERELKFIQHFVGQNTFNKQILDKEIFLIDVNSYCETNVGYYIGECTILRFSIRDGIKDQCHWLIKTSPIPIGYASDVKLGCEQHYLQYPDESVNTTDLHDLLAVIRDYLTNKDGLDKPEAMYTMPDKIDQVQDFIMQICDQSAEDWGNFPVYKLDLLFFHMANALRNHTNEGFPKESLALARLRKDAFMYTPLIGCLRHNEGDKTTECTTSRVKRWAYTVLDSCCPLGGVEALPGKHVPPNIDIQAAYAYKEMKRHEQRPADRSAASVSSRDSFNDSYEAPSMASAGKSVWKNGARPVRELQPIRKPKAETIKNQQISPALQLSDVNFPPMIMSSGRGTGRPTMADILKKVDLNK